MSALAKCAVCVVAVTVAQGVVADAQAELIVNVDLTPDPGHFSGQGALADPGNNYWNGYNLGDQNPDPVEPWVGRNNNIASDGTTVTMIDWWINKASAFGGISTANTNDVTNGYYYELNNAMTLKLYDLDPSKTYDLYLYGCQDYEGGRGSTFTIGGDSKTTDGQLAGLAGGFKEGSTHVAYTGLSPDANNVIVITVTHGPQGTIGFLNGFQLKEVPEPSVLIMLVACIAGLVCYAWRKRR